MTRTPSRDRCNITAFEVEIESLWLKLQRLKAGSQRTVVLSDVTGLLIMRMPVHREEEAGEVGTYTGSVELVDLRADCFDALDRMRRSR